MEVYEIITKEKLVYQIIIPYGNNILEECKKLVNSEIISISVIKTSDILKITCSGCRNNIANQIGHMDFGGCLEQSIDK